MKIPLSPPSAAAKTFKNLLAECRKQFPPPSDPTVKPSQEFLNCREEAIAEAKKRLSLDDFEMLDFPSPDNLAQEMKSGPAFIDADKFNSLKAWMGNDIQPMVIFKSWKPEDYPVHTIEQRANFVASGTAKSQTCRWAATDVRDYRKPSNPTAPKLNSKEHE